MHLKRSAAAMSLALSLAAGSASALIPNFTETFDSGASNWLNGDSGAPTYFSTGGVDNSGYISFTAPEFTSSADHGDPLKIMFRANASNDASGDAFVGDWISNEILYLSLTVRHNYTENLTLYARLASTGGHGASLANDLDFTVTPNTWTTITIPIVNSNPPFTSFGSGDFNSVFSNIQNLQFGLYLPNNTLFEDLRMDIDNVSIIPEPSSVLLISLGLGGAAFLRRRRKL